jgi:hypothetical protein
MNNYLPLSHKRRMNLRLKMLYINRRQDVVEEELGNVGSVVFQRQ